MLLGKQDGWSKRKGGTKGGRWTEQTGWTARWLDEKGLREGGGKAEEEESGVRIAGIKDQA